MGKCPHCKEGITEARAEAINLTAPGGEIWRGLAYLCPHCQVVLSVGADPVALNEDLATTILDGLRKR